MTLIVSGTNRPYSNTLKIAKYYQKVLTQKGEQSEILDLSILPESLIHPEAYSKTYADFKAIQEKVSQAAKFIFVVPEYNGSFPGIMKLFLDACAYPDSFYEKKVALVGIATGKYGNIRGIEHLTGVCNYMNLHVMPLKLHIPYIHLELNENEELYKEDTLKFTNQQIEKFINF